MTDYGLAKLISTTKNLNNNEWELKPFTNENIENVYIIEKSDLFILGIDIYNLLFKGTEKSLEEYYSKIENSVKDDDLKDLLKKLIVIDAHKRIDWNDYFNHPFFNIDKIDFDKIENIKK